MRRKVLNVHAVHFYPSVTNYHLVITLVDDLDAVHRALWALWMGSDRLRGVYVLERIRRGVAAADVLSTPKAFIDGFRFPDDACACASKHKAKRVTDHCPAMKRLMMDERSGDYFPRNLDKKKRTKPLNVPWGRVPKKLLLES